MLLFLDFPDAITVMANPRIVTKEKHRGFESDLREPETKPMSQNLAKIRRPQPSS